ncbi:MAG: hypothetical protein BV459_07115 [Thermoplasmata archaeon M11B2D]|nr:MAG: hypothetical protein BV459_07115 [Thermoplasmata archaeon M11B2D]
MRTFRWDGGICTILFLRPNQRCSWHSHKAVWNQFTCIRGCVGIRTEKGYTTKLCEKQTFTVEPNVDHEFQTYEEGAIVEEIAYVIYDESDIDRKSLGGPLELDESFGV